MMSKLAPVDSVIFDLDGTLWDATEAVTRAWQAVASQLAYVREPVTQEMIRSITGLPFDVIHQRLFPYLSADQQQEFKTLCAPAELHYLEQEGGQLQDELEETLHYLSRKYPLFIVSNCQSGYIEVFLKVHRLEHFFRDIECFGNTGQSKAANIRAVMERNGLHAPVYVGDTMSDYEASKSNNIPFVYTSFGFGQVAQADARISQVAQLRELL